MNISPTLRRPVVAAAALAAGAAIALTGCSSNDSDDAAPATSSVATSAATGSPESGANQSSELDEAKAQEILRKAVDAATPEADLDGLVDGDVAVKKALFGFNKGASKAGYTPDIYTVSKVDVDGEKATATVSVKSPHAPAPSDMQFAYVNVDGTWKLSGDAVTQLTSMGKAHGG